MAAKKSPFAGMNLSEQVIPERGVGRDQRLFQGSARQPANQPTGQEVDGPDSQPGGKPKSARQSYPKRTYHLNPETVTLLEDMQRTLKRTYG
ncbi:MAG: hypothetical protein ACR2MQ_00755, partial [Gemmatimonadaceae bacterium]